MAEAFQCKRGNGACRSREPDTEQRISVHERYGKGKCGKAVYDYASAVAANQVYGKELEGTIKSVKESGIDPGFITHYKEMEDALNESVEGYEARDQYSRP